MNSEAITQRIWQHSKMTGVNKLILLALAQHSDGDGFCWPGYATLGEMVGLDRRNAMRNLAPAIAAGEVMVWEQQGQHGGRGYTNIYLITLGQTPEQIREIIKRRFELQENEVDAVLDKKGDEYITLCYLKRVSIETLIRTRDKQKGDNPDTLSNEMSDKAVTQNGAKGDNPDTRTINDSDDDDEKIDKDLELKQTEVLKIYYNNIRLTESPLTLEEIVKPEYLSLPILWWRQAIKIATDNGVYKWCYVRGILDKAREANLEPAKVPKEVWANGTYQHAPKKSAKQDEGIFTFPPIPDPPPLSPLPPHALIWQQAQAVLKPYAAALTGVEARSSPNGTFILAAPDDKKQWIDGRLKDKILQALRQFKPDIQKVEVLIQ